MTLFPQLIAGPIVRYQTVADELEHRDCTADLFADGVKRFACGIGKKVLLANNIGLLWEAASAQAAPTVLTAWLGIIAYGFQIYFDFSGYSDMAIGSAKLLGIELSENFRAPYLAKNIADFWRRWHITLMNWFKDYIYIPLGGKEYKTRNTAIVFLLSGLWHGANWTFVTWGLYNASLFPFFRKLQKIRVPAFLMWLATFSCVVLGFMIFRSASITDAVGFITRMFSFTDLTAMPPSATKSLIALAGAGILFFAELKTGKANNITDIFRGMPRTARRILYIAIVSSIIIFGAEPAAFIYFQF